MLQEEWEYRDKQDWYLARIAYEVVRASLTKEGRDKLEFSSFFYQNRVETPTEGENPVNGQQSASVSRMQRSKLAWLPWAFNSYSS